MTRPAAGAGRGGAACRASRVAEVPPVPAGRGADAVPRPGAGAAAVAGAAGRPAEADAGAVLVVSLAAVGGVGVGGGSARLAATSAWAIASVRGRGATVAGVPVDAIVRAAGDPAPVGVDLAVFAAATVCGADASGSTGSVAGLADRAVGVPVADGAGADAARFAARFAGAPAARAEVRAAFPVAGSAVAALVRRAAFPVAGSAAVGGGRSAVLDRPRAGVDGEVEPPAVLARRRVGWVAGASAAAEARRVVRRAAARSAAACLLAARSIAARARSRSLAVREVALVDRPRARLAGDAGAGSGGATNPACALARSSVVIEPVAGS